jgi:trehalose-6-phosphatase
VISGAFIKNFASQSPHKYKIIIFFSDEAKDSVIFSFFILLHKSKFFINAPLITTRVGIERVRE